MRVAAEKDVVRRAAEIGVRIVGRLRPQRNVGIVEASQREPVKQLGTHAQVAVHLEDGARVHPPIFGVDVFRIRTNRHVGGAGAIGRRRWSRRRCSRSGRRSEERSAIDGRAGGRRGCRCGRRKRRRRPSTGRRRYPWSWRSGRCGRRGSNGWRARSCTRCRLCHSCCREQQSECEERARGKREPGHQRSFPASVKTAGGAKRRAKLAPA
jgi:hypothetical protein